MEQPEDARLASYWALPADTLLERLGSRPGGLTGAEAAAALLRHGPNTPVTEARAGALWLLLRQYRSPLVLILVFGAAVSALVRDWVDALIILAIVIGSTLAMFAQERRASNALQNLRQRLSRQVTVARDGVPCSVPVATVVPGDIVELGAGDLVPADGVLLTANCLLVTEAVLTGEAFPVEKQPGAVAAEAALPNRTNCLYQGTSVRSGMGRMVVVHTGTATRYGDIAHQVGKHPPETEFQRGVRQFGYLLTQVMAFMTIAVLAGNLLLDRPVVESLLFAVALAVGLSPELLPAIISVTLSAGARRMAERGVLVRRLEAIENLGSMTVLCSDKTGTLTEGTLKLDGALDVSGTADPQVLTWARLNAILQAGLRNPLDDAIAAASAGIDTQGFAKVAEVPYDFVRRCLTVVVADQHRDGEHLIITKGALANVLELCTSMRDAGTSVALDDARRQRLLDQFREWSEAGSRVLGLAVRTVPAQESYSRADETGLVFAGFLLFSDPPKSDAQRTIGDLAAVGVKVKVITGDNRYIAAHVARAVGLPTASMLTGIELDTLSNEALQHRAPRTELFVEVDPNQKDRIIRALQHRGAVVGYLGDGINDAPALHTADVGISVDQAVDVARESADLVLLEHDLDVLRAGIAEGRRTIANTLKYISITTSANFGNMISMAVASMFLPFLPLLATQILLNNFLSDFPAVAIAGDQVDAELVARPYRWRIRQLRSFMVTFGLVSSAFDFLTFGVLLYVFQSSAAAFRTGWFVESLFTELAVMLIMRTRRPFYRSRAAPLLLGLTVLVAALTMVMPYLGPVSRWFGFVPMPAEVLAALIGITVLYVAATEWAKARFYRHGHAVARKRRRSAPRSTSRPPGS